jgi:hypothetical protein
MRRTARGPRSGIAGGPNASGVREFGRVNEAAMTEAVE